MPLKLTLQGLQADISAVDALLQQAKEVADPIGEYQFAKRKEWLKTQIDELTRRAETTASVALFFGGGPVMGSRGISADFAGKALEQFQDLVSRTFAINELGQMGERGPIPLKGSTQLMVTEIARGSFGFVLDELSDQTEMLDTSLKIVVENVATLLERTASSNELEFEEALENIDARTLIGLRDFFINLDSNKATLRLVEDRAEFTLDAPSISRARQRTEATSIDEAEELISGTLVGFLPNHKKFEVQLGDRVIFGSVAKEAADQYASFCALGEAVIGRAWKLRVRRRIVRPLNRPEREVNRLLEFGGPE